MTASSTARAAVSAGSLPPSEPHDQSPTLRFRSPSASGAGSDGPSIGGQGSAAPGRWARSRFLHPMHRSRAAAPGLASNGRSTMPCSAFARTACRSFQERSWRSPCASGPFPFLGACVTGGEDGHSCCRSRLSLRGDRSARRTGSERDFTYMSLSPCRARCASRSRSRSRRRPLGLLLLAGALCSCSPVPIACVLGLAIGAADRLLSGLELRARSHSLLGAITPRLLSSPWGSSRWRSRHARVLSRPAQPPNDPSRGPSRGRAARGSRAHVRLGVMGNGTSSWPPVLGGLLACRRRLPPRPALLKKKRSSRCASTAVSSRPRAPRDVQVAGHVCVIELILRRRSVRAGTKPLGRAAVASLPQALL